MNEIEGFILAGGSSSRMGRDKAQLRIAEQTFSERIAGELLTFTDKVTMIGGATVPERVSAATDVFRGVGALGGLHGALSACQSEWALVVACDLPFVTRELFAKLAMTRGDSEAVVPVQEDGRPQPLCALYRRNPCLEVATSLIEGGKRRPLDLLDRVKTKWIPFAELKLLNHATEFFVNINTPEDYDEATRKHSATPNLT
ncbi:MAG TPA: molybdenum cofactor guanylyltransferase [Pyrinomonadaceae bacterium]|nr:molybdenum cofactor guanylyltransferase [Pyrinomonadaceae bacterium]